MSIGGTNPQPGRSAPHQPDNGASSRKSVSKSAANGATGVTNKPLSKKVGDKAVRDSGRRSGPSRHFARSVGKNSSRAAGQVDSRKLKLNGMAQVMVRKTIPSVNAASQDIQRKILAAVEKSGFTPHSVFAIKLALEEAMINAIKHGNKLDPTKNVHIEAKVTPKVAQITIEDEGPGFKRSHVPDPTLEENREKCSGRGILLIESYMNSAQWSHNGRRLRMIKRNGEEPGAR
jgi:serine/threonine-protein kinase RsbW